VTWDLNKLKAQMAFEDAFRTVAESRGADSPPAVLLVDRGVMDTKAFVSEEAWDEMLSVHGWDEEQFLRRYDSVIHLVSTAIGAEAHYSGANNHARRETVEEARAQDSQIRDAWVQHPNFRIISNRCDGFDAKLSKVKEAVCEVAGLPMPVGGTNKQRWLVKGGFHDEYLAALVDGSGGGGGIENLVVHHVETDFIAGTAAAAAGNDICIRRRRRLLNNEDCTDEAGQHHFWMYSVHERRLDGSTRSRPLARRDYEAWLLMKDHEDTLASKMTSFIFEENFWKLDEFYGRDNVGLGGDGDVVNNRAGGGSALLTLEAGSLMTEPPPSFFTVMDRVGNLSLRETRDTLFVAR
jgi:hypothetical protein